jgi:hypothetical protein
MDIDILLIKKVYHIYEIKTNLKSSIILYKAHLRMM